MHPAVGKQLPHSRVDHRVAGLSALPGLKLLLGGRPLVVTHLRVALVVIVVQRIGVSEKNIGIKLSPANFLSENRFSWPIAD